MQTRNNEMQDSRTEDIAGAPIELDRRQTDRQTSESMAFVSPLQRQQLLCCQIDEKALFAFLFVVAFSFSFFFYFVSKGHILSPLSREMISLKRSAEFPSTVQIAFHGYLFLLFYLSSVNLSSFSTTECW